MGRTVRARRNNVKAGLQDQNAAPADLLIDRVEKAFAGQTAVRQLSLEARAGELISLLGPSGCGKTTTLRMVAGFETPDSGRIVLGGRDVTALATRRRGLGMVFQNYSLFPHKTVAENVAFGLRMAGIGRAERESRVAEFLDLVQLAGFGNRYPAQLSGGQQQRVALARSLVVRPKVLLLDEPLGALDRNLRESMQFELRSMQQRLNITTLLVTHDQEEALSMSDRVAVMNQGRILQIGAPAEIYDRPKTRFVAEFLGTSNLFETGPGRPDLLSIRPERVLLGAEAEGHPDRRAAEIIGAVFRGTYAAYQLRLAENGREIVAYRQASGPLGQVNHAVGERLVVAWRPEDAVVVERD
jgi:putative spermidine/putrescine transport system ATP-binding protein